jgi:hypothetical protein
MVARRVSEGLDVRLKKRLFTGVALNLDNVRAEPSRADTPDE